MEKVATFLDKNRIWFSWGTMVTILGMAIWLIQAMNSVTNTINIMRVQFDGFADKSSIRANYIDDRILDFEIRVRDLEKKKY